MVRRWVAVQQGERLKTQAVQGQVAVSQRRYLARTLNHNLHANCITRFKSGETALASLNHDSLPRRGVEYFEVQLLRKQDQAVMLFLAAKIGEVIKQH